MNFQRNSPEVQQEIRARSATPADDACTHTPLSEEFYYLPEDDRPEGGRPSGEADVEGSEVPMPRATPKIDAVPQNFEKGKTTSRTFRTTPTSNRFL